jgi:uncharacterized membrane protein
MNKILNLDFYKQKGFYVSLASIVLLLIANFCYLFGFKELLLEYNNSNVMLVGVIGIVVFAVLLLVKYTSNYSPIILWMVTLVSFLLYILNIYMYFTGVFYNGLTAEAFGLIEPIVLISTVLFLLAVIVSNVSMYMNHVSTKKGE